MDIDNIFVNLILSIFVSFHKTTTSMKNSPKLAILQSLDTLDQVQMEQVLVYIRQMLVRNEKVDYRNFKSEAMKEIRKALRIEKKVAIKA